MKPLLVVALLAACLPAQAATYYRDREVMVPAGQVCMFDFTGTSGAVVAINASMVQDVVIGTYYDGVKDPDFGLFSSASYWKYIPYIALHVNMINKTHYEFRHADKHVLELLKLAVLANIKNCGK